MGRGANPPTTRPPATVTVRRTVLFYGLLGGLLIASLQLIQYRYLVVEHSLEVYGGVVAIIFAGLGIWLGVKMTGRKTEKELFVSENTVKTHSSRLLSKLNARRRTHAVQIAKQQGLIA